MPVPVDEHGIVVERCGDVDAVVVTPAHQFPTGVVLAPERRAQLIAWARERDALIVEDDYDAEYRYDRDPVGALQGLAPDRVALRGLGEQDARAGAAARVARRARRGSRRDLADEKDRADRGTPVLEQAALADLLARGEVDRHLRRTRRRYRARRDALVAALAEHLPDVAIGGAAAGLHVVAWLPEGADEAAVAERGARARRRRRARSTARTPSRAPRRRRSCSATPRCRSPRWSARSRSSPERCAARAAARSASASRLPGARRAQRHRDVAAARDTRARREAQPDRPPRRVARAWEAADDRGRAA